MMLPGIKEKDVFGKKVLVRADLDVDDQPFRLEALKPTLEYLEQKQTKIILVGHKGRPQGMDPNLSLREICLRLGKVIGREIEFRINLNETSEKDIVMYENLRFNPGEELNDPEFSRSLAGLAEIYVNEAFAASHREHASIVGVPRLLPHVAGIRFRQEVEKLDQILKNPKKPVVFVISGFKKDKIDYLEPLSHRADSVLVAGRLPDYIEMQAFKLPSNVQVASLNPDKEDITLNSIEKIESEIKKAETVLLVGPIGKYEEEGHLNGTKRIFETVANLDGLKFAGGGDTQKVINKLGLAAKFSWISVGGGAMLEYLSKGTLPGIIALLN